MSDGRRFILALLRCSPLLPRGASGYLQDARDDHYDNFLTLRLRGALHGHWMEDVRVLRRWVVAGRVTFDELRGVASDLVSAWDTVREYVRYTGLRHIKSYFDKVGCIRLQFFSFL